MSAGTHDVTVFPTVGVKEGRPKPYLIRWKVAGREKVRAHTTKAAARRFQSELLTAHNAGQAFDVETCLPVVAAATSGGPTVLELAREVVAEDWGVLAARSNGAILDGLSAALPALVPANQLAHVPDRITLEQALLTYLNPRLTTTGLSAAHKRALGWLERQSLPVGMVTDAAARAAMARCETKRDGTPAARSSVKRRRAALSKVFTVAISRDLIDVSPLRKLRKQAHTTTDMTRPIDRTEVASAELVTALLEHVRQAPVKLLLALMFYAGLRPGEADGLRVMDVYLVPGGRSELAVRRTTTETNRLWSATGEQRDVRAPKHTAPGSVRRVPIPRQLVPLLAEAIEGKGQDDLVVQTRNGTPIAATNRARAFLAARERWAAEQPVRPSDATVHVPYSLRHCAASLWLQVMPPVEVARRLGHSVDVLMRTYANVMPDQAEHYNAAMDDVMGA